jgi:hypothetical protein
MCGLVGYITSHAHASSERRKFLEQALIIDTLRGEDSTGIFVVPHEQDTTHRNGCAGYGKVVCDGYGFVNSDTYKSTMGNDNGKWRAVVGHNRAATIGGVSVDTAHPFNVGPITLVHNGTLRDMSHMRHSDMCKDSHNDSHAIARNLAEVAPGGKSVIEDLDGAFALIWHDARDDRVRIVRNKERPLHMALSEQGNGSTLYFASEAGMLAWLLKRNGVTHGPIFEPKPGWVLTFDKDPADPATEKVELWQPSWRYYNSYSTHNKPAAGFTSNVGKPSTPSGGNAASIGDDKVLVLGGSRVLPDRLRATLDAYHLNIKEPVTFCPRYGVDLDWGDPKRQRSMAGGELIDVNKTWHKITAVVYNVPDSVTKNQMSHMWTIRPVGVKIGEGGQPIVVCKLISFSKAKCGSVVDVAYWDAIDRQREENAAETNAEPWGDCRYEGPHGQMLRADEWLQETSGGCAWCGLQLSLLDADDVEWVNEGTMPVCPDCVEDMASVVLN